MAYNPADARAAGGGWDPREGPPGMLGGRAFPGQAGPGMRPFGAPGGPGPGGMPPFPPGSMGMPHGQMGRGMPTGMPPGTMGRGSEMHGGMPGMGMGGRNAFSDRFGGFEGGMGRGAFNEGGMGRGAFNDGGMGRGAFGRGEGGPPYGPGPGRNSDWFDGGRDGRFPQGPGGPGGRMDGGGFGRNFHDDEFDDEDGQGPYMPPGPGGRFGQAPPYSRPGAPGGFGGYGRNDEFGRRFDDRREGEFGGPYDGRPGMPGQDDFGRPPNPRGRQSPYHSPYQRPMAGPQGLSDAMGQLNIGPQLQMGNPDMPQMISLEMSAKGLKKKDLIGKSDPVCYVYVPEDRLMRDGNTDSPADIKWKVLSRTEIIKNSHSPTWGNRVNMAYAFQELQLLRFSVYDADGEYDSPRDGDKIGECCLTLGDIVQRGVVTVQLVRNLRSSSTAGRYGSITVRAHSDQVEGKIRLKVSFGARNLPKADTIGKADPFYVFTHIGASGEESKTIHKSETIRNTQNPDWRPRRDLIATHGKPWDRIKLRVSIYDHDTAGKSDLLGTVDFTLQQLTRYQRFDIINEKKAAEEGGHYTNSGELVVSNAEVMRMPAFLSFLQGGLQLRFIVCVDFSNKDERRSLHEPRDGGRLSTYGQALQAVGEVMENYLHDRRIAAYGFGAKPRYPQRSRHDPFPLNENPQDPRVFGVEGLLDAYHRALDVVKEGSKTKFEPLIRHVMRHSEVPKVTQGQQHFTILLVLTDGQVDDMEETVDSIIECSAAHPVAIIFVGVGRGDFSDMRRLDGDKEVLKSERTGKRAKHDIVQFSQFKPNDSMDAFAASVLKEVPRRLVTYMVDLGVFPNAQIGGAGGGPMGGMGRGEYGHGGMGRGDPMIGGRTQPGRSPGMNPMGGPGGEFGGDFGGRDGFPPGMGRGDNMMGGMGRGDNMMGGMGRGENMMGGMGRGENMMGGMGRGDNMMGGMGRGDNMMGGMGRGDNMMGGMGRQDNMMGGMGRGDNMMGAMGRGDNMMGRGMGRGGENMMGRMGGPGMPGMNMMPGMGGMGRGMGRGGDFGDFPGGMGRGAMSMMRNMGGPPGMQGGPPGMQGGPPGMQGGPPGMMNMRGGPPGPEGVGIPGMFGQQQDGHRPSSF